MAPIIVFSSTLPPDGLQEPSQIYCLLCPWPVFPDSFSHRWCGSGLKTQVQPRWLLFPYPLLCILSIIVRIYILGLILLLSPLPEHRENSPSCLRLLQKHPNKSSLSVYQSCHSLWDWTPAGKGAMVSFALQMCLSSHLAGGSNLLTLWNNMSSTNSCLRLCAVKLKKTKAL